MHPKALLGNPNHEQSIPHDEMYEVILNKGESRLSKLYITKKERISHKNISNYDLCIFHFLNLVFLYLKDSEPDLLKSYHNFLS